MFKDYADGVDVPADWYTVEPCGCHPFAQGTVTFAAPCRVVDEAGEVMVQRLDRGVEYLRFTGWSGAGIHATRPIEFQDADGCIFAIWGASLCR